MREAVAASAIALVCFGFIVGINTQFEPAAPQGITADFELIDRGKSRFATIRQEGYRDIVFDPATIHQVIVYDPTRGPDTHAGFAVWVHGPGASVWRFDCEDEAETKQIVEFIKRNQ